MEETAGAMGDPVEAAIKAGTEAVLIAGPTASGKSGFAVDLARRHGGVVVNADAMQVYGELRLLTARPSPDDEAEAPHRLYGHVPAAARYSVGRWLEDIAGVLREARERRWLLIIAGGTGLYFKALTEGLAAVPAIPAEVRERVAGEAAGHSSEELHKRLTASDPEDAVTIRPSDRTRILRALEVFEATGRALIAWQKRPVSPLIDPRKTVRVVIDCDRPVLHDRIARRAAEMIKAGAMEEARTLGALGLSPDLPAMKAIGVRELLDHIAGKVSLDEAIAGMKTETRRYAKRQMTWFRHQMADWVRIDAALD